MSSEKPDLLGGFDLSDLAKSEPKTPTPISKPEPTPIVKSEPLSSTDDEGQDYNQFVMDVLLWTNVTRQVG